MCWTLTRVDVAQRSKSASTNLAFDSYVKKAGFYYPPDPSSGRSSVLGGNLGENAGGPIASNMASPPTTSPGWKSSSPMGAWCARAGARFDYPEYDLTGLVVGSEGTLAIVTRAYVRLIRNPPGVKTMMVAFNSEEAAGKAVSAVIAAGLVPATLEMMDQRIMRIIESFAPVGFAHSCQSRADRRGGWLSRQPGHADGGDQRHLGGQRRLRPTHCPKRSRTRANLVWAQECGGFTGALGPQFLLGGHHRATQPPRRHAGRGQPNL